MYRFNIPYVFCGYMPKFNNVFVVLQITINVTSSVPKKPAGRKVQADQTSTMAKKKKTGTSFGPGKSILLVLKQQLQ